MHSPAGLHSAGYTQSSTDVHITLQLVALHVNGEQSTDEPFGAVSVCIPSQLAASLGTHLAIAALHVKAEAQSSSVLHEVPQAVPVQT
jgi:hypothetical protein